MFREQCIEKKMTLEELASKSGVSGASLNRYELGQRVPNIVIAKKIANVLGCTIDELLTCEGKDGEAV